MSTAPIVTAANLHDPQDVRARILIHEAVIILGRLYSDVAAIAQSSRLDSYQLQALAARCGREGMRASRRLKKAADGRP